MRRGRTLFRQEKVCTALRRSIPGNLPFGVVFVSVSVTDVVDRLQSKASMCRSSRSTTFMILQVASWCFPSRGNNYFESVCWRIIALSWKSTKQNNLYVYLLGRLPTSRPSMSNFVNGCHIEANKQFSCSATKFEVACTWQWTCEYLFLSTPFSTYTAAFDCEVISVQRSPIITILMLG